MAYIGKQPLVGNFVKLDAITTSATTTFNLTNGGVAYYPQSANNCLVSLNGILQAPTDSFTISGSTIVFSSALTTSDVIDFIIVLGDVLNIGTPSDNTVSTAKLASGLVVPYGKGGTGLTTLGTAGQALVVNSGATALEYSTVGAQAGQVIQVLSATDSTQRSTTSTSFVTASNTLSVTITPSSASNKIFLIATVSAKSPEGTYAVYFTIYRGATNLGNATYGMGRMEDGASRYYGFSAMNYLDSPNTTSALTYQVYFYAQVGSSTSALINVDGAVSSITAFEIKG